MGTYWPATSWTTIYWMESSGEISAQALSGEMSYRNGVTDINGDGKKEVVVYSYLDPAGRRGGGPTPEWPKVYRLKGEKYVPATRDFPGIYDFYNREVLPQLNAKLDKEERMLSPRYLELGVATLEMQRDKILRFLGLDPRAGLKKARQWAKSGNPDMIYNAYCVFHDIPGHEAEARAAKQAEIEAFHHQHPTTQPLRQ